jgi:hypothetical protein
MAVGWIRAIRAVPWNEVIAAAPVVVGGAKKILTALQKKERADRAASRVNPSSPPPNDPELRALHRRIVDLEGDLVDATQVLNHLADQHAQLVIAVEALRRRTRIITWTCVVLAMGIVMILLRMVA